MLVQTAVLLSLIYLRMEMFPEVLLAEAVPLIGYYPLRPGQEGNNRGGNPNLLAVRKFWGVDDKPVDLYSGDQASGHESRGIRSIPQFLLSRGTRMQRIFRPVRLYETFTRTERKTYMEFKTTTSAFKGISKATLKVRMNPSGDFQLPLTLQALVYSMDNLQHGTDTPSLNLTILTLTPTPDQSMLTFDLTDLCKSLQDASYLFGLNAPMSPNLENDAERIETGSEPGKNIRLGFTILRNPCNSILEGGCSFPQTILDPKAALPVLQVRYGSSDILDEQAASFSQLLRDLGQ